MWLSLDCLRQVAGMGNISGDGFTKSCESVVTQRQPQLKGTESSGQLQRLFEECEAFYWISVERASIVSAVRERVLSSFRRAIQKATTIQRLIEPLVRVERNRVGKFQAVELFSDCDCGERPIGPIHVKPGMLAVSDLGKLSQGINRASVDCAG